jgi:hypothetical protein
MAMLAAILTLAWASLATVQANEKNCASQIAERQQEEEKRIDQQKAIALAQASKEFEPKTKGYKAEFHSIYFVHSFDPKSCDYQGLDSVNVVYGLSSADKPKKNVVAHLGAGLKSVKEISEHAADNVFVVDKTSTKWSGFIAAALKNSGTAFEKLTAVNVKWTIPSIESPDMDDADCVTISCDVGAWAGLYGMETTSSGQPLLAQIGSNSSRACSWEVSTSWYNVAEIDFKCSNSHYLWYEFIPAAGVKCTNAGTVSSGNYISAEVKKASATNSYTMTVSNLTTGKSCSVTQNYSLSAPYYGAFIVEPPLTSTGEVRTLPKFSTITMSKAMVAWLQSGGGGYVQNDLYYIANTLSPQKLAGVIRQLLYQGSSQNIAVGDLIHGGSFTETYLTSSK